MHKWGQIWYFQTTEFLERLHQLTFYRKLFKQWALIPYAKPQIQDKLLSFSFSVSELNMPLIHHDTSFQSKVKLMWLLLWRAYVDQHLNFQPFCLPIWASTWLIFSGKRWWCFYIHAKTFLFTYLFFSEFWQYKSGRKLYFCLQLSSIFTLFCQYKIFPVLWRMLIK